MTSLVIKICGIRSQADLDVAAGPDLAADWCGFIFHPASPRSVTPDQAAALSSHGLARVGVFVSQDPKRIADIAARAGLDYVQLHGQQSREQARELRALLSRARGKAVGLIRVLWPERYSDRAALEADLTRHAPETDIFLLDAGTAGGGSGQTLPWKTLAGLQTPRPWLLAGGLTPDNVGPALAQVQSSGTGPLGVDLNSGLENTPGHKDPRRVRAALRALRAMPPSELWP